MIIDLSQIPPEGMEFTDTFETDIFGLEADTRAKADPKCPCWFETYLRRVEDCLVLRGSIGAGFLLECARCTEIYREAIELQDHTLQIDIEGRASIDLTDYLREDILLALPSYPNCAESTVSEYHCAGDQAIAKAKLDAKKDRSSESKAGDSDSADPKGVWDALDELTE